LTGKTPLDMILVPLAATFFGSLFGLGAGTVVTPALNALSKWVAGAMTVNPLLGSMCLSLAFAIFLMTPASSAALAIAIALNPISSGATLIGTTAQFVGFLAMSFQENNLGANIAQGLITPKVQFPNLLKRPALCIPPFIAAMVSAAVGTLAFKFSVPYTLGGLGLNSLIAPINLASSNMHAFWVYMFCGILMPAVISAVGYRIMRAVPFGLRQRSAHGNRLIFDLKLLRVGMKLRKRVLFQLFLGYDRRRIEITEATHGNDQLQTGQSDCQKTGHA
jgi:uncharacterized membrane protein